MLDLLKPVEISEQEAITIASGMRAMALADGEEHESELAMIDQFLEGTSHSGQDVDLGNLGSEELQGHFLKSLALVALADGAVKEEEKALLRSYDDQQAAIIRLQERIKELKP